MTASTTRRSVLAAAGAASAAITLAACGGKDSGSDQDKNAAEGGGDDGGESGGGAKDVLGKVSEIPEGGGKVFKDQKIVVTRPSGDEYKAFSAICTHQGCPVKEVTDGTINCPCHNSKFDINDGSVKAGPAKKPLPGAKVVVKGDTIHLA